MQAMEIVQKQQQCSQCEQMREIENARLARRELFYTAQFKKGMTFNQLVAYGKVHFDTQIQCYKCKEAQ